MPNFILFTPIVRDGGTEALILANNIAARALKQGGLALHNAVVGEDMLRTTSRVEGPSHSPALSFEGDPKTPEQADEVAVQLAVAVTAHLADVDVAHRGEDKTTPPVKTPKPSPGGAPTTFPGADPDGGIVLIAAKPGVTYTAKPGPALKVTVAGTDIETTFVAGTTTPIEEAIELGKATGGLLVSATPTGTGKGLRAAATKKALPYGGTTASRNARLNELKAIVNAHDVQALAHNAQPAGATDRVKAPDATDDPSSIVLATALLSGWTGHLSSAALEIQAEGF